MTRRFRPFLLAAALGCAAASSAANPWTPVGPYLADGITPVNARSVAASNVSNAIYAATDAGVFRTLDSGATWTALNAGLSNLDVREVLPDPSNDAILYARTGTVLAKSVDGGASWTDRPSLSVLSIAPSSPTSLYAAEPGGFLLRSTDGGESGRWEVSIPFPPHEILSIAVDPHDASIVFAGTEFSFGLTGAIYRSTDAGSTWTQVFSGNYSENDSEAFDRIVFDPQDSQTIYATWLDEGRRSELAGKGGVYKSSDGGQTWASIAVGNPPIGFAIDPQRPSTIYLSTGSGNLLRSSDGGSTFAPLSGLPVSLGPIVSLAISLAEPSTLFAAAAGPSPSPLGVYRATFGQCAISETALCLGDGRFRVEVDWQRTDSTQKAHASSVSSLSGDFWFANPGSVELVVKVLDGRSVNGFFWVFYGAMTDRGYTITVTDRETGEVKTYTNEPGQITSRADTKAFSGGAGVGAPMTEADLAVAVSARPKAAAGVCVADAVTLCLSGGRFRVQVGLPTSPTGPILAAPAVPLTPESGAFVFKDPANLEVSVKVLDGTSIDGHFWVFVGGLSDRGFEVTVTDTETGIPWTYFNPVGVVQSHADTSAF